MTATRSPWARLIALLIAAATGLGGCSWILVKPLPPNYERGDAVDCTTDRTPPVIDTLLSISEIAGIAYVSSKSNDQNKDQVNSLVTGQLIGLIMWGSSAIYGYRRTSACIDAREDTGPVYPRHLGVRPRVYSPPPPPPASASPTDGPALSAPPVVTPGQTAAPQQEDDDSPSSRPDSSKKLPPVPQKLDQPRFGN